MCMCSRVHWIHSSLCDKVYYVRYVCMCSNKQCLDSSQDDDAYSVWYVCIYCKENLEFQVFVTSSAILWLIHD